MSRTIRNRHNRGDIWWKRKSWVSELIGYPIDWGHEFRNKNHRDGKLGDWNGYGRRKRYRDGTNEIIRNQEKVLYAKLNNGYEYDDLVWPDKRDGKVLIWNIW